VFSSPVNRARNRVIVSNRGMRVVGDEVGDRISTRRSGASAAPASAPSTGCCSARASFILAAAPAIAVGGFRSNGVFIALVDDGASGSGGASPASGTRPVDVSAPSRSIRLGTIPTEAEPGWSAGLITFGSGGRGDDTNPPSVGSSAGVVGTSVAWPGGLVLVAHGSGRTAGVGSAGANAVDAPARGLGADVPGSVLSSTTSVTDSRPRRRVRRRTKGGAVVDRLDGSGCGRKKRAIASYKGTPARRERGDVAGAAGGEMGVAPAASFQPWSVCGAGGASLGAAGDGPG
jgi:hypothetical protein